MLTPPSALVVPGFPTVEEVTGSSSSAAKKTPPPSSVVQVPTTPPVQIRTSTAASPLLTLRTTPGAVPAVPGVKGLAAAVAGVPGAAHVRVTRLSSPLPSADAATLARPVSTSPYRLQQGAASHGANVTTVVRHFSAPAGDRKVRRLAPPSPPDPSTARAANEEVGTEGAAATRKDKGQAAEQVEVQVEVRASRTSAADPAVLYRQINAAAWMNAQTGSKASSSQRNSADGERGSSSAQEGCSEGPAASVQRLIVASPIPVEARKTLEEASSSQWSSADAERESSSAREGCPERPAASVQRHVVASPVQVDARKTVEEEKAPPPQGRGRSHEAPPAASSSAATAAPRRPYPGAAASEEEAAVPQLQASRPLEEGPGAAGSEPAEREPRVQPVKAGEDAELARGRAAEEVAALRQNLATVGKRLRVEEERAGAERRQHSEEVRRLKVEEERARTDRRVHAEELQRLRREEEQAGAGRRQEAAEVERLEGVVSEHATAFREIGMKLDAAEEECAALEGKVQQSMQAEGKHLQAHSLEVEEYQSLQERARQQNAAWEGREFAAKEECVALEGQVQQSQQALGKHLKAHSLEVEEYRSLQHVTWRQNAAWEAEVEALQHRLGVVTLEEEGASIERCREIEEVQRLEALVVAGRGTPSHVLEAGQRSPESEELRQEISLPGAEWSAELDSDGRVARQLRQELEESERQCGLLQSCLIRYEKLLSDANLGRGRVVDDVAASADGTAASEQCPSSARLERALTEAEHNQGTLKAYCEEYESLLREAISAKEVMAYQNQQLRRQLLEVEGELDEALSHRGR